MILGLNLSFAVKRWLEPEVLAKLCREDFGVRRIQFTLDLIDPWWPRACRDAIASAYRSAFETEGVAIDSVQAGLAAYTYAQFLSPIPEERILAMEYYKRAVDTALSLGSYAIGTPAGGMSNKDAADEDARARRYASMLDAFRDLATYGKGAGLREILIEATPLLSEFPHDQKTSLKLAEDLSDTDIPVRLIVDWGHALYEPLLGEAANMDTWYSVCGPYIGAIHLQQTDGALDRHWDFTHEDGIVAPEQIVSAAKKAGLEDIPQYLEVIPPFETPDEVVYAGMKKTMERLHSVFAV